MWLLDKFLKKIIKVGKLVITDHDGKVYEYGPGGPGVDPIRVRLTDKGAAYHIARYPQVGAGEAYMDGRLTIEPRSGPEVAKIVADMYASPPEVIAQMARAIKPQ